MRTIHWACALLLLVLSSHAKAALTCTEGVYEVWVCTQSINTDQYIWSWNSAEVFTPTFLSNGVAEFICRSRGKPPEQIGGSGWLQAQGVYNSTISVAMPLVGIGGITQSAVIECRTAPPDPIRLADNKYRYYLWKWWNYATCWTTSSSCGYRTSEIVSTPY
jgi:hypothetical protein